MSAEKPGLLLGHSRQEPWIAGYVPSVEEQEDWLAEEAERKRQEHAFDAGFAEYEARLEREDA
jgi:hypothetical protein